MQYNFIENIEVFQKVNFPNLKDLELNNNNITDLDCFNNINQFQLKLLYLDGNHNINKYQFANIISKLRACIKYFKI